MVQSYHDSRSKHHPSAKLLFVKAILLGLFMHTWGVQVLLPRVFGFSTVPWARPFRPFPTSPCWIRRMSSPSAAAAATTTPPSPPLPKVVILAGPTAVGKSDVAAALCAPSSSSQQPQPGVIVSADSVQAYPGVSIGANKPTASERQATPHLLIDVVDQAQTTYNAATWRQDAVACIQALTGTSTSSSSRPPPVAEDPAPPAFDDDDDEEKTQAQRWAKIQTSIQEARAVKKLSPMDPVLPVVVGGTMMYLQWLVHGRPDALRPTETAVQTALDMIHAFQQSETGNDDGDDDGPQKGDWYSAVAAAKAFGPKFAQQVDKLCGRDWYRLRRILEVALTVQEKGSSQDMDSLLETLYSGKREDKLSSLGFDVRCFFLCPTDRMGHSKVVDERCEQMIQRGLLRETTDLACTAQLPDMAARAIGYRQTLEYLESRDVADGDQPAFISYLEEFTTATRRYSKRQMQWFRRDKEFFFIPVDLNKPKNERVESAAVEIGRLVAMSRQDYDQELHQPEGINETTRMANEAQGKTMRTYQFARRILVDDSEALQTAMDEADACRHRYQSKCRKVE